MNTEKITIEEFLYYGEHLKVRFEEFNKGWITFTTKPHQHTGRVFKIITGRDMKFHRDEEIPISHFHLRHDKRTWGEIHQEGKPIKTTLLE